MESVLTKNNFQFNSIHCLQILGTQQAWVQMMASSYANIFMGKFELDFVYTYPIKPLIWKWFIDDCFCIWAGNRESLDNFIQYLNSCDRNIQFRCDISQKEVHFLDTTVSFNNGQLKTDLYCKPTDSHMYLGYSSAHPPKSKDCIPYSQF